MKKITLDVAGFFYGVIVDVSDDVTTVKDVMLQAQSGRGVSSAIMGNPVPKLSFTTEKILVGTNEKEFVDQITITHSNGSARSRQSNDRVYDDGAYGYADDPVVFQNQRIVPVNPNEEIVLSWQYYLYDTDGKDQSRAGAGTQREVIPFSEPAVDSTGKTLLTPNSTIVWRLIALALRPTGVPASRPENTMSVKSLIRMEAKASQLGK
jgi:hypothetical protein